MWLQISVWHEAMTDETLADSILDILALNPRRIDLLGESARKVIRDAQVDAC